MSQSWICFWSSYIRRLVQVSLLWTQSDKCGKFDLNDDNHILGIIVTLRKCLLWWKPLLNKKIHKVWQCLVDLSHRRDQNQAVVISLCLLSTHWRYNSTNKTLFVLLLTFSWDSALPCFLTNQHNTIVLLETKDYILNYELGI